MIQAKTNGKSPGMNWPLGSHFSTMLQNPRIAFRDPKLKEIAIDRDDHNQPKAFAGSFANVYKGTFSGGSNGSASGLGAMAVRVFTSGALERRDRYQAISDYVGVRHLGSLVNFAYQDNGIRSTDGKWYPLMTMEWVSGQTLYKWVRAKCLDKDRRDLDRVSGLWIDTIKELLGAGIAHGDLQHGNVMVTDAGKLKLVDYDCMCVPKLEGKRNLEIGVKPYQHPDRNEETPLTKNLDNFSALFILVALKALAAAPDLWNTFVEQPQYDKLLFREEDFQDPSGSRLIQALHRSPDAEVQRLSRELVDLTRTSIDQVPTLPDLLFSFATVESLLNQRDFDAAVELLSRGRKQVAEAPPPLQPRIREAQQRVECRCKLDAAVQAGDEAAMQRLYQPKLLDDYPRAQPSVAIARQAPQVIPVLARLNSTMQSKKWREFVQVWDAHQKLLVNRKSAERFSPEVGAWRHRNQACDALLKLIQRNSDDPVGIEAAWGRLFQVGGHPEAEPYRQRIEGIVCRQRAWTLFQQVPLDICEASDVAVVRAWNETQFAGWGPAEQQRKRLVNAQSRLALIARLRRRAEQEMSLQSEVDLAKLSAVIPDSYEYELAARVQLARQRIAQVRELDNALKKPASDLCIEIAWRKLAKLDSQLLVPAKVRSRIDLALQRVALLRNLQQVPFEYPPQQAENFDPLLLAAWNDDLLADCHDAEPWRKSFALAARRKTLLGQLEAAIAAGEKTEIAALAVDPALEAYPLRREWSNVIRRAIEDIAEARRLLAALKQRDRSKFRELFDARIIRRDPTAFAPYRDQLRDWMRTEILPAEKLGLAAPTGQRALTWDDGAVSVPRCRIRWNWPNPRFSDVCLLLICRESPCAGADLRHFASEVRLRVDRKSYEEGGGCRALAVEPSWGNGFVVVAALVDLGFQSMISQPLVLGRLELPAHGKRKAAQGGFPS
jgi:hypothetical protein